MLEARLGQHTVCVPLEGVDLEVGVAVKIDQVGALVASGDAEGVKVRTGPVRVARRHLPGGHYDPEAIEARKLTQQAAHLA